MIKLLLQLQLLTALCYADSIILTNECSRTTEECIIELETIKGEPGRDCAIFSSEYQVCQLQGDATPTSESDLKSGNPVITETKEGTVVTWTEQHNGKESGHNELHASSVWSRLSRAKRNVQGTIIQCICKPQDRKKRALSSITSVAQAKSGEGNIHQVPNLMKELKEKDCFSGFSSSGGFVTPKENDVIRKVTIGSASDCAELCKMEFVSHKKCSSFGYSSTPKATENCVLLSSADSTTIEKSELELFTAC